MVMVMVTMMLKRNEGNQGRMIRTSVENLQERPLCSLFKSLNYKYMRLSNLLSTLAKTH